MKTLQEQFNLIQEGKGHKDMFLKSARRLFPEYVTNYASYNEVTTILKQRGVLSEIKVGGGIVTQRTFDPFKAFDAYVNEEYTVAGGVGPTYASQQENPIKPPKPQGVQTTKAVEKNLSKEVEARQEMAGYNYNDEKNIDNLYGQEQMNASYKRYPQDTIEVAGDVTKKGSMKGKKTAQSVLNAVEESTEDKKVISEMGKIKNLIGFTLSYNLFLITL